MKPGTRKLLTFSVIAIALFAITYLSVGPIRAAYVARQVTIASTPDEEIAACRLLNKWEYWYSVRAFDSSGIELKPHQTGNYSDVDSVEIVLRNGVTIKRQILNSASLSHIYGE